MPLPAPPDPGESRTSHFSLRLYPIRRLIKWDEKASEGGNKAFARGVYLTAAFCPQNKSEEPALNYFYHSFSKVSLWTERNVRATQNPDSARLFVGRFGRCMVVDFASAAEPAICIRDRALRPWSRLLCRGCCPCIASAALRAYVRGRWRSGPALDIQNRSARKHICKLVDYLQRSRPRTSHVQRSGNGEIGNCRSGADCFRYCDGDNAIAAEKLGASKNATS